MKLNTLHFAIVLAFASCTEERKSGLYGQDKLTYYNNGVIKSQTILSKESKPVLYIKYKEDGSVDGISVYDQKNMPSKEVCYYYENGKVSSKVSLNDNKEYHGATFYFHKSGLQSQYRIYENQKKVGLGVDFFDTLTGDIEATLWYNTTGDLVYRKTFDKKGDVVNIEGRK